jgi:glycosyltransferase involved in cell wall biosynthesis
MKTVVLLNGGAVPHYRVPVYSRLAHHLLPHGYHLVVIAERIQDGGPQAVEFQYVQSQMTGAGVMGWLNRVRPDAIIFWTNPRPLIFGLMLLAKARGIRLIHWGHRRDLQSRHAALKHALYDLEHLLDDAIIVYSPGLKERLPRFLRAKTFAANNTLDVAGYNMSNIERHRVRAQFGIRASKIIICLGRLQARKRIGDLLLAFEALGMSDVGLVLGGPDEDGLLHEVDAPNIHKVGPVYGEEALALLAASDVYCLPGAIGLGIVDAFFCGLPVVTERVRHGPEFMYFREGVNGFAVDEGDISGLADCLRRLLSDDALRARFSQAARDEILTHGHIDRMCSGFRQAIDHAFSREGCHG